MLSNNYKLDFIYSSLYALLVLDYLFFNSLKLVYLLMSADGDWS